MKCKDCDLTTDNKKTFSNHIRYGCPTVLKVIGKCIFCGGNVLRKHDGKKQNKFFCGRDCYTAVRKGKLRGSYKEFVMISGYKYLQAPHHPNSSKKGYVAEHRLIAEAKIGRFLLPDEVVHHVNENKLDNSPKNLMVLTNSEHMKLHKQQSKRGKNGKFTI